MADFVAFDFETANANRYSVCAIGYAVVEKGEIIHKNAHLIKPKINKFSSRNTKVHGIKAEDVKKSPEFNKVWETELQEIFSKNILVAHYAAFDAYVLRDVCTLYRIQLPQISYLCSMQISKETWRGLKNYKLNTIAKHLGYDLIHHDPLSDAETTAKIVVAAEMEHNTIEIKKLIRSIRLRPKTL